MTHAAKIFQSLPGLWSLQRYIPNQGNMRGTASFAKIEPETQALFYSEQGIFIAESGYQFNARREYVYRLLNGKIIVFFVDHNHTDRLFHSLNFKPNQGQATLQATAFHQCINDAYTAHYTFFNQNKFRITYFVNGPRKNYVVQTTFFRE